MQAVFDLLRTSPGDEQLLTAASVVSDELDCWYDLFDVLSRDDSRIDVSAKAHLRTMSMALKRGKISDWPMNHIEKIIVGSFPRWGSLVPKDSLGELFDLLQGLVTHGVGLLNRRSNSVSPGIPTGVLADVRAIRAKLLQIIWFSSALSTLGTVLKCSGGEGKEGIINVLLHHYSGSDSLRQTVVEAQEKALQCLGALYECVAFSQHDESLDQLAAVLKHTGSDFQDSSSLPLIISVSSFLVGGSKVKVRPETVDAAAFCLSGMVRVCELSPSLFQMNTQVNGEQIIGACLEGISERKSVACVSLLESLMNNLSPICFGSKLLIEGVQKHQSLHKLAKLMVPELSLPIQDPTEVCLTSGRALALSRSGDFEKKSEFVNRTILDSEWLKSNCLLAPENLKDLSDLYSLLQSEQVRSEWVLYQNGEFQKFHEPSLVHLLSRPAGRDGFEKINGILFQVQSCAATIDSLNVMLSSLFDAKTEAGNSDLVKDLKSAVLNLIAEVDVDSVRETPQLVEKLCSLLELICQQELVKGLPVAPVQDKAAADSSSDIVANLVAAALSFSRDKAHWPLINQALRCVPFFQTVGDTVISGIIESASPSLALSATPAVLTCLEALVHVSTDLDMQKDLWEYVSGLVSEFCRANTLIDSVAIGVLSLTASALVVLHRQESYCVLDSDQAMIWTLLTSHPVITSAARASSWDQNLMRYSTRHLVWIHALYLGQVLLSLNLKAQSDKFLQQYSTLFEEKLSTAHTADLATLEEACLISRIAELFPLDPHAQIRLLPFQFTSLVIPKPPSLYPKSRAEKLSGNLPVASIADDVRSPCELPSVFAQRVVWIASDILSSSLRSLSRASIGSGEDQSTQSLFHSLLDCSHFFVQYLNEVALHKSRILRTVRITSQEFVPLSVHLSVGGRDPANIQLPPTARTSASLLHSMSSPLSKSSPRKKETSTASLMDSLTPRNSPKSQPAPLSEDDDTRFLPAVPADCSMRTGLSFIAPSLVSEDDFTSKLVEVLSLCLILATRLATTEALIRPLLDLLLTTQSSRERLLPAEAIEIISELIDFITPKYDQLAAHGRSRPSNSQQSLLASQFPAISAAPQAYAALGNIRY